MTSGRNARKTAKQELGAHSKKEKGELTGRAAYGGQARGPAVIVKSWKDLKKIKYGDILVCHSTSPKYLPYMGKVKAIVCEEGSLVSHAAITAREMRIPCIVGVDKIVNYFKDGQIIEVDADRNIVRKIK